MTAFWDTFVFTICVCSVVTLMKIVQQVSNVSITDVRIRVQPNHVDRMLCVTLLTKDPPVLVQKDLYRVPLLEVSKKRKIFFNSKFKITT